MVAKQLELLHELIPQATVINVLVNRNFPGTAFQLKDVQEAARTFGHPMHVLNASTGSEINTAFATMPNSEPTRSSSLAIHSFSAGYPNSSHLRHFMRWPRFTHSANTSRAAALF